jgi:very-short-patch-repair endonuclease
MDERIEQLAAHQHGAFSRAQAFAAGVTRPRLDGLLRRGRLSRLFRCVYRLASIEITPFTTAMAAVLAHGATSAKGGHGAVASHGMAALLWQYLSVETPGAVDVSGERLRHVPGITRHRVRLCDDEAVVLRGVPVTSPARTILDLAGVVATRELEQALAVAERRHGASLRPRIRALLVRRPRHRGSGHLRRLLAALDASGSPPLFLRSRAEEEALAMIRRARLPEPQTNARVAGLEVDFAWPALRIAVEVDGFEFHGSREAFQRDHDRDRNLAAAGFQVLRFTWRQLTRDADATLAALAATIARQQDVAALRGG